MICQEISVITISNYKTKKTRKKDKKNSSYKVARFEHTNLSVGVEVYYPYTIDSGIRYNCGRTFAVLMIDEARRQIAEQTNANQVSLRSNRLDNIVRVMVGASLFNTNRYFREIMQF